jgi:hypothetical protein
MPATFKIYPPFSSGYSFVGSLVEDKFVCRSLSVCRCQSLTPKNEIIATGDAGGGLHFWDLKARLSCEFAIYLLSSARTVPTDCHTSSLAAVDWLARRFPFLIKFACSIAH